MKTPFLIQILTYLISCDSEHEDDLSFCLLTLDAASITKILDTHKQWRANFPDALEIVLEDSDRLAQFLSADDDETLALTFEKHRDADYRIITDEKEFIQLVEEENSRDAWNIMLRKIIIRDEDVRFVAVYEYNPFLRNAFTASQMIPIAVFEKALRMMRFQERRKLENGFVEYKEIGAFYKAENETTLLIVPMLEDGSPEMDGDEMNASPVLFELIFGDEREEYEQILAELLEYNATLEGENK